MRAFSPTKEFAKNLRKGLRARASRLLPEERLLSLLKRQWWYYSVELPDGTRVPGHFPDDLIMLPRLAMSQVEVEGRDCLDIGTMEGLMPTLMCRKGARRVVATDDGAHCLLKLSAVQRLYDVRYRFLRTRYGVPLSFDLPRRGERHFDFINMSGLLYHVFSPMHWLGGVRPLLRNGGLMLVSTWVVLDDSMGMQYNAGGGLNPDATTHWFISLPCLDYLLRSFRLAPIDLYYSHLRTPASGSGPFAYMTVVCRGVDRGLASDGDSWMQVSVDNSPDSRSCGNWALLDREEREPVPYRRALQKDAFRPDTSSLDLREAVRRIPEEKPLERGDYTQVLRLSDRA